ncbi:MAG: hypothetical protein JST80_08235 [Bdellovibrionales bacterium]|nr:hypothetical protein [Bdellovibrionales bacterium]
MKSQFLFSSLMLAVGMIPSVVFAQENCSHVNIIPQTTCIIPQSGTGSQYTMVYKLPLTGSCVMSRTSGNSNWAFPSYLKSYTNENNPGHQPRPYVMATTAIAGQDYTVTGTPSTFVCVKDIGSDCHGAYDADLNYNFANNGNSAKNYRVTANNITANLCTTKKNNGSITAAEFANITIACGAGTILPVTLISFNAAESSGSVTLNWETATEINFSNFEVQRSNDGAAFSTISVVQSTAGSFGVTKKYSTTDSLTGANNNVYYRLKMNDLDGKIEYSKVAMIRVSALAGSHSLYPSVARSSDAIRLQLSSNKNSTATLRIVNYSGQTVNKYTVQLLKGNQTVDVKFPANTLPGIYVVNLSIATGDSIVERVTLQ